MLVINGTTEQLLWRSQKKKKNPASRVVKYNEYDTQSITCVCERPGQDSCGFDCIDYDSGVHHEFEAVQVPLHFDT